MKSVAIVGLGWIGMPLAFMLSSQGYRVTGSKTTADGVEAARMSGLDCYQLNFEQDLQCEADELTQLLSVEQLVITLPASRQRVEQGDYRRAVQMLVDSAQACGVRRVIFLSSTSVYGDAAGVYSERSPLRPTTVVGETLQELEEWLHALPLVQTDILRLAGLVGPDRHPGRFLAGRQGLGGGSQCVNLVHRHDVLVVITQLLKQLQGGRLYNVCAPQHPRRDEFYTKMARQLKLPAPDFIREDQEPERIIDGSLVCRELAFRYRYPDPMSMTFV
ncbi:MAG: SDR family oxidoreductase [Enterobacteriaceae bacterium]